MSGVGTSPRVPPLPTGSTFVCPDAAAGTPRHLHLLATTRLPPCAGKVLEGPKHPHLFHYDPWHCRQLGEPFTS
eukprot:scaffold128027_cov31-Tisochrysis_lutea.AAC.2